MAREVDNYGSDADGSCNRIGYMMKYSSSGCVRGHAPRSAVTYKRGHLVGSATNITTRQEPGTPATSGTGIDSENRLELQFDDPIPHPRGRARHAAGRRRLHHQPAEKGIRPAGMANGDRGLMLGREAARR